jgi:hypothetical protein
MLNLEIFITETGDAKETVAQDYTEGRPCLRIPVANVSDPDPDWMDPDPNRMDPDPNWMDQDPNWMDPDPDWIRIQMDQRIRTRIGNPDTNPGRQKLSPKKGNMRNFMFKEFSGA